MYIPSQKSAHLALIPRLSEAFSSAETQEKSEKFSEAYGAPVWIWD